MEVVITSECSGQLWNTCVWEPLTGTTLRTFKGGISGSQSLCVVGGDYLIASIKDKPIIQVWALNRQDQITTKMIMPGIIQVLAVSPCNNFCVGALSEQLLVWQLSTGKLVASLRRHYQNVSDVKFTADSSRFVSAGAEGLVLLWSLDTVLHSKECEPDSTWSDHSLPVTGLHVTKSLIQPLAFSVSLDQTCKIRDLNTGRTLFNIQFGQPLRSVAVDHAEESCYVGSQEGKIYRIDLLDPPRGVEQMVDETASRKMFVGHEKAVTCLSVSMDGCHLLSGSDDESARVWDMASGQCVRILAHRGPLTNAFFAPRYKHLDTDKFHPRVIINTFEKKRHDGQLNADSDTNVQLLMRCPPLLESFDSECQSNSLLGKSEGQASGEVMQNELSHLKYVNRQLYAFAVDKILNNDTTCTTSSNKKRK
ncbi:WD repeat-containing protein 18 [Daphnia magna]|uniref:Uncharacterized protein n=2 Tax=Daphnia magna TaxID=35525 RepID=A0ABQ9ZPZ9_9CRUS|nr:WD repeat-containing protein 18 [Daphnia magna]KAK4014999.1 hypothetical protein OUZ56_027514 [Daphnia magna]KZS07477.1 WD repeat-containing protein 18 [Daphnia magna]